MKNYKRKYNNTMKNLLESLSYNLPKGNYKLFHIQSQPFQCKHLLIYHKKNAQRPALTIKIKHFISLIDDDNLVIMGIEVYIYLTVFDNHLKHSIFISKADTTGLSTQKYKINKLIDDILQYLIQYDIRNYCRKIKLRSSEMVNRSGSNPTINSLNRIIDKLREGTSYYKSIPYYNEVVIPSTSDSLETIVPPGRIQTSISLFTRASEQYLFPNSSKNERKHVIGGDDLLNWWIKLINRTLLNQAKESSWNCRLHIPGSDNVSISKKLPAPNNNVAWSIGSIFDKDAEKLAINQIPLFPDDPKGRFLEHLIVENRYKSTSLKQFWQELGFRQEFRLGNVVGIIGCEREERGINTVETTQDVCVLPLGQYKKILNSIKNADFSDANDIKALISVNIPDSMKEFCVTNYYTSFEGLNSTTPRTAVMPIVNDLNLNVKRKSDTPKREIVVNDLSGSLKRKPVNDISASIKRRPVNDISGSIKRKPVNDISGSVKRKSVNISGLVEKKPVNNLAKKPENTPSDHESTQEYSPKINIINSLIKRKPKK
jgi:regulator of Ty1 transposition protein 109